MILQPITDNELKEHIASLPIDGREVFLMADGTVRVSAVQATGMINQMRANHGLGIMETYILGQAYIAGALLASTVKGNDRVQLQVECGGPVKGLSVESWASGAVRGYLVNNPIPITKPVESFDTSMLYGPGFLSITKILEGSKTPFTGQIMMEYGNLANDLALYFRQSEQTPTLFCLSIKFDRQGRVWGAGGLFIQALPGCADSTLSALQDRASSLKGLGSAIADGGSIREYAETTFADYGIKHEAHFPVGFSCPCSRENFRTYLANMPENEKEAISEGSFPLVLECFNCGTDYSFEKQEIDEIFQEGK